MKALVTGGCGFIGSHLIDRLVGDGHDVVVLDDLSSGSREHLNPMAKLTKGDVADGALVSNLASDVDVIFHLAAIASVEVCEQDPVRASRTNVTGTTNVFKAAMHRPVVYASSAAVYGDNPDLPLSEISATGPLGNYGKHKLRGEELAKQMSGRDGLKSVGLRFFNVYGPRQDPTSPYSGVISRFMRQAVKGLPLTFFGDGEQTRDFIYVGDVVELLIRAWRHAKGCEIFNGCTGKQVSLKQLAASILKVTASKSPLEHAAPRQGDIRHSLGSPLKANNILSFAARTKLEDGLHALYRSEALNAA